MTEFLFDATQGATKGNQWSVTLVTATDDATLFTTLTTMINYHVNVLGLGALERVRIKSITGGDFLLSISDGVGAPVGGVFTVSVLALGV